MKPIKPHKKFFKRIHLTEAERKKRFMEFRRTLKIHRIMEGVSLKEKEWLDTKVLVSDGTSGDVVTVRKKKNKWFYYCHVCQFGKGIQRFAKHWESQEHKDRLKEPVHPVERFEITQSSNNCFTTFGSQCNPGVSGLNETKQQLLQDTVDKLLISYNGLDEDEKKFLEEVNLSGKINAWYDYCTQAKKIEANLFNEMMYYKENPNEHQQYKTEWKQFCIDRNEHLKKGGCNALYTNVDDEFQIYWDLKLRDIFQEAFKKSKAQLRTRIKYVYSMDIAQSEYAQQKAQDVPENINSIVENSFENSESSSKEKKPISDVTVIDVLRDLSVLEDQLGSLGPKVVDLLSKAILLEKSSNSSSLLFEEENCLLLKTAKEKLKGMLQRGLIQQSVIGLVESVIKNVTYLINKSNSKNDIGSSQKYNSSHEELSHHDYKSYDSGNDYSLLDGRKSFGDNKNYYHDEGKAYEEKTNCYRDEKETAEDKKNIYHDEKKIFFKDGLNFRQERRTYNDHTSSSPDERKTFYRDKLKMYDREMSSSRDERKIHGNKMGSSNDERKNVIDKMNISITNTYNNEMSSCLNETNSYGGIKSTRYNEKKTYGDGLSHVEKRSYFKEKELSYKASELSTVLQNFRCLIHFSYTEILEMSQKIGTSMMLKGQNEITKEKLMEVVDIYIQDKTEKDKVSSNDYFNKQLGNDFRMNPVTYDHYSSAYASRNYSSITHFPDKNVNDNSFKRYSRGYPYNRQVTSCYTNIYSRPGTHENFYQSNSYRRY